MGCVLRLPVKERPRDRVVAVHGRGGERALGLAQGDEEQVSADRLEPADALAVTRRLADRAITEREQRFGAAVLGVKCHWNVASRVERVLEQRAALAERQEEFAQLVADGLVRPECLERALDRRALLVKPKPTQQHRHHPLVTLRHRCRVWRMVAHQQIEVEGRPLGVVDVVKAPHGSQKSASSPAAAARVGSPASRRSRVQLRSGWR